MDTQSLRAKELRTLGWSLSQIADTMHVSTRTVTRYLAYVSDFADDEEKEVVLERSIDKGAQLLRKQVESGQLKGDQLTKALNTLNRIGSPMRRKKEEETPAFQGIRQWWKRDGKYYDLETGEIHDKARDYEVMAHIFFSASEDVVNESGEITLAK